MSSVVVSMLRLPWWTRLPLGWQRCWISRKVRERDANTDYKILVALPPTQSGFIESLKEFRRSQGCFAIVHIQDYGLGLLSIP